MTLQRDLSHWLTTSIGHELLQAEALWLKKILQDMFGDCCVQIGGYNCAEYHSGCQMKSHFYCGDDISMHGAAPMVCADMLALPFQPESVDLIVLPHTLDCIDNPLAVLDEVNTIVIPDGHVVVIGFNPIGIWRLARMFGHSCAGLPGCKPVSVLKIKHHLCAMGFEQVSCTYAWHHWPKRERHANAMAYLGALLWPSFGALYVLHMRKRLTKPQWVGVNQTFRGTLPAVDAMGQTQVQQIDFNHHRE